MAFFSHQGLAKQSLNHGVAEILKKKQEGKIRIIRSSQSFVDFATPPMAFSK